jgi:ketosteroid isomerase-like protein
VWAAINAHDLDAVLALVTDDIVFESTSPPPDGTCYQGRAAVAQVWGDLLASTPRARFAIEEQFCDGAERVVVRWRYDWGGGHVRGVDIVRVRDGRLAESLAFVKGQRDGTPGQHATGWPNNLLGAISTARSPRT